MYVCVCHAVRDRELLQAIDRGIDSFEGLMDELGLATACGGCEEAARQMLAERLRVLGMDDWAISAA